MTQTQWDGSDDWDGGMGQPVGQHFGQQAGRSPQGLGIGRRRMLLGALALGMGALGGCGRSPEQVLRLGALSGTVPAHLPGAFRAFVQAFLRSQLDKPDQKVLKDAIGEGFRVAVAVQSLDSGTAIAETLLRLQAEAEGDVQGGLPGWVPLLGRRETVPADLMLLGDRWLSMAQREQWIQPLEMELDQDARGAIADDRWRAVMAGTGAAADEESDEKAVWGMPYRWGTTVLVYRKDRLAEMGGPITDWGDLWRSQLRGKVVLLNQAREVIGAVLKEMGESYNAANLDDVAGLGDRLEALHRQALTYTNTDYLQPLLMGDAWVAMGWSRDVLPVLPRRSQLAAVVPRSGSALWADLWVCPSGQSTASASAVPRGGGDGEKALQQALRRAWVEFCWTPDIARRVTLQTSGASPQFLNGDWETLAKDQQGASGDRIRFPAVDVLDRCEFLLPLSDETRQQYQRLWSGLGQVT